MGELAGRHFRRIHLLDEDAAGIPQGFEIDTHMPGPAEQQAKFLVEDEEAARSPRAAASNGELLHEQRFACAGRPQDQGAGPLLDAAAQQQRRVP